MANPSQDEILTQVVYGTAADLARGRAQVGITTIEALAKAQISERTFRALVAKGVIRPVARRGREDIYSAEDVEQLRRDRNRVR